jgi:hypothetical protein
LISPRTLSRSLNASSLVSFASRRGFAAVTLDFLAAGMLPLEALFEVPPFARRAGGGMAVPSIENSSEETGSFPSAGLGFRGIRQEVAEAAGV